MGLICKTCKKKDKNCDFITNKDCYSPNLITKIKNILGKILKENNCKKCPYYNYEIDYNREVDKWCDCLFGSSFKDIRCRYPMFIKKILYSHKKAVVSRWDKQAEKSYLKEEKERYELGLDEEEYYDYKQNNNK